VRKILSTVWSVCLRITASVSHRRQPTTTLKFRLSQTAASGWLHALVRRSGHSAEAF
jgi:hypothetical protein